MTQISLTRSTQRNRQRGFTLMELLIVMSIMIILMLIAIPNFISMKAQADETSAIQSLRAIYQAQIQYQTTYPANGFDFIFCRAASAGKRTRLGSERLQRLTPRGRCGSGGECVPWDEACAGLGAAGRQRAGRWGLSGR